MAKSTPQEKTKTKPDFNAFVVEEQEGKDPFWLKVGAAWAHKDGKGYNLELQAMPPSQDGKFRIVLREWKEPEAKS